MNLSAAFNHKTLATNKVMLLVCLAIIPGALLQAYWFGYGVIINLVLCSIFALSAEYFILRLRNRDPITTLKDNSALVTGLLLGVSLPSTLPVWMTFIGVYFAIIFAKQVYGGLGNNPFNPAMVGYVLLLISFPVEMTAWLPSRELSQNLPNLSESLQLIFLAETSMGLTVEDFRRLADGFTMATPLDQVKTQASMGLMTNEIFNADHFSDNLAAWIWVNGGYLIGGLILLATKVIRWRIPIAFIAGIWLFSQLLHSFDPELYRPACFHLFTGATMLGAFFIATDPVSASTTPKGRLLYGFMIGGLIVIIRTFGGYPDAVAFAVLLLNLAVPTIDHYTKPLIYGHKKELEPDHE